MDYGEHWVKTSVQRADEVVVVDSMHDQPYVSLTPAGPLRRISFKTVSHDQGVYMNGTLR
jgi:hypothetical protein